MLTKDQLLNPRRRTHAVKVPEYDEPLLLAEPSAALGLKLRQGGAGFDTAEGLQRVLADMLVDAHGRALLTPEEAASLLENLSTSSVTAIINKVVELYTGKDSAPDAPAADAVPSTPSTSA